jgi:hypothetical protein
MSFLGILLIVLVAGYFVVVELLDWTGRLELIENRLPKLWRVLNARPSRLILLFLIFGILLENYGKESETEPLVIKVNGFPTADPGTKDSKIAQLTEQLNLKPKIIPLIVEPVWKNVKLTTYSNQKFHDELVDLDGKEFSHCTFNNVTFLYHGLKPFSLHDSVLSVTSTQEPGTMPFSLGLVC